MEMGGLVQRAYCYQYLAYPIVSNCVRVETGRGKTNELPVHSSSIYIGGRHSEACRDPWFGTGSSVRSDVDRNQRVCKNAFTTNECAGEDLAMKNLLLSLVGGVLLAGTASATTVQYTLSPLAPINTYLFTFTTNASLAVNQALVVQFPWAGTAPRFTALNSTLSSGGVGLVVIHQPNSSPGSPGDVTQLVGVVTNVPTFSIIATFEGTPLPATLPFQILNFNGSTGSANVTGVFETGLASGVPEPSSAMLSLVGMVMVGGFLAVRRC